MSRADESEAVHAEEPSADADRGASEAPAASAQAQAQAQAQAPLWQRTARLLLPAVLAAGAMGLHWAVNVPEKIVESPNDQGAKNKADKAKDKKKKDAEKRRAAKRDETRTPEALDADWETYGTVPFDEEPTRTTWARRHQVVINRAVVEARKHAFKGAPEEAKVVLSSTTCRTVRCRFQLRSAYAHELDLMTSTLERLHEGDEPVWRSFTVEPLAAEPTPTPTTPGTDPKHAVQVTVAFRTDDTDTNALEIPEATPENEDGEAGGPENGGEPNEAGEPENGGEPNEDG